jgi:hypothetical protein
MIILDKPNKTLQISLAHAGNRNEIPWTCCYKNFIPGSTESEVYATITGITKGPTNVIVMPAPKAGTINELIVFSIVNNDNGRNVVTVNIYDGAIYTPVQYSILRAGRTLFYPQDKSFLLYSTSGIS